MLYRTLARILYALLLVLLFLLVRSFCDNSLDTTLKTLSAMLVAAFLGLLARDTDYDETPPSNIGRVFWVFLFLFRKGMHLLGRFGIFLLGPVLCLILYAVCAYWELLPGLIPVTWKTLPEVLPRLPPFYFLLLAGFFAGCFWPPFSELVEMLMARITGETRVSETSEERTRQAATMQREIQRARAEMQAEEAEKRLAQKELFNELLVPLVERVMQLDGRITEEELEAIRQFLKDKLAARGLGSIEGKILREKQRRLDLDELKAKCDDPALDASHRSLLLDAVYRVVYATSQPPQDHLELAWQIGKWLGLDTRIRRGVKASYQRLAGQTPDEAAALATLGLKTGADFAMVQQVRQWLLKRYHPDNFTDLEPDFQRIAAERVQAINAAYELLERIHKSGG